MNPNAGATEVDRSLLRACCDPPGGERRWERLKQRGASNAQLLQTLGELWREGGQASGSWGAYLVTGGRDPQAWLGAVTKAPTIANISLRGLWLATQVRRIFDIDTCDHVRRDRLERSKFLREQRHADAKAQRRVESRRPEAEEVPS